VTLDEGRVLEIMNLQDEIGILSLYLGLTPDRAGDPKPGWTIAIDNELRELRERVREVWPHAHVTALDGRITALRGELERFADASRIGRGRALFATIAADRVESIALQVPFRDRVICDHNAYVRPLVAALDEGRPAGIVSINKRGTRLLEWRLGEAEEISTAEFTVAGRDWREKTGPAPAQPLDSRVGGHDRDQYEDRVDMNRLRFVREQAREVANEANRRRWDRLIVAGDPRLTKPFAEELEPVGGEQLHVTDLSWQDEAPNTIAEQAWDLFKLLRRARAVSLIEQVRDLALSGGAGALGPADVCACLNEGRVERLLVGEDAQVKGFRGESGLLLTEDQQAVAGENALVEEPLLVERRIERALDTSARVVTIDEDVAAPLHDHGGVAALLRW
jgi:peptide subunit release factor 1 (eRF1)